jgi:hypothetical protein
MRLSEGGSSLEWLVILATLFFDTKKLRTEHGVFVFSGTSY